jgi:hypothetical protein
VATLTGCGAPEPPRVTFFADGHAVDAAPLIHCDVRVRGCEQHEGATATLRARPGKPVQVSLPSEITDTPWAVNVQYSDANGQLQPVKQDFFAQKTRHAYTATPGTPGGQVLVVEIQQLGAAYAADEAGRPILDEAGNPQLVVRAVWSLQVQPS